MSTAKRHKKNLIVSYKNLSDDLKELFKESYPDGYDNYMQRFVKPNGETIFVVPFETDDTAYMVKFEVVIDTLGEDLDKALFDEDDDSKEDEFAPLSEALEKDEADSSHKERVLRHGDFEAVTQLPVRTASLDLLAAMLDDYAEEQGWDERWTSAQLKRRISYAMLMELDLVGMLFRSLSPTRNGEAPGSAEPADSGN